MKGQVESGSHTHALQTSHALSNGVSNPDQQSANVNYRAKVIPKRIVSKNASS